MEQVMEQVDFDEHFRQLPQFCPSTSESVFSSSFGNSSASSAVEAAATDHHHQRMQQQLQQEQHQEQQHVQEFNEMDAHLYHQYQQQQKYNPSAINHAPAGHPPSGHPPSGHPPSGHPATMTTNRQILDKRRSLVLKLFEQHGYYPSDTVTLAFQQLHKDLFPNKFSLQVKIREVRQNIMKKTNSSPVKTNNGKVQ